MWDLRNVTATKTASKPGVDNHAKNQIVPTPKNKTFLSTVHAVLTSKVKNVGMLGMLKKKSYQSLGMGNFIQVMFAEINPKRPLPPKKNIC